MEMNALPKNRGINGWTGWERDVFARDRPRRCKRCAARVEFARSMFGMKILNCRKIIDLAFLAIHGRFGEDASSNRFWKIVVCLYRRRRKKKAGPHSIKSNRKRIPKQLVHHLGAGDWRMKNDVAILSDQGAAAGMTAESIIIKEAVVGDGARRSAQFDRQLLVEEVSSGRELDDRHSGEQALPFSVIPKGGFYDFTNSIHFSTASRTAARNMFVRRN